MNGFAAWVGYFALFEIAINVVTAMGWFIGEQTTGAECTPDDRATFHVGMTLVGVIVYLMASFGYAVCSTGGTA